MKQFELKFTEENLERHISYNPLEIYTVRDEVKGWRGQLTNIDSKMYILGDIYSLTIGDIKKPSNKLWKKAGFQSRKEYVEEIQRIYRTDESKPLFVHHLYLLAGSLTEQMKDILRDIRFYIPKIGDGHYDELVDYFGNNPIMKLDQMPEKPSVHEVCEMIISLTNVMQEKIPWRTYEYQEYQEKET